MVDRFVRESEFGRFRSSEMTGSGRGSTALAIGSEVDGREVGSHNDVDKDEG